MKTSEFGDFLHDARDLHMYFGPDDFPFTFPRSTSTTNHPLKFVPHIFQSSSSSSNFMEVELLTAQTYRDWIATVKLDKYALGGSGKVVFFLCNEEAIPADPWLWFGTTLVVGWYGIYTDNPSHSGCINCLGQGQSKYRIGGTVHLTKALEKLRCPLTGPEPVNLLRSSLHWRLCDSKRTEIAAQNVPSLEVSVQSSGFVTTFYLKDGIMTGGETQREAWTAHPEVTFEKVGGVGMLEDDNAGG